MEPNSKLCEICGNKSTDLCWDCPSYFCDTCLQYVHSKEQNNQHKIEKTESNLLIDLIDTTCANHPKIPMNLFCLNEKGK